MKVRELMGEALAASSWAQYELRAEQAFLADAASGIKKVAGRKAEKVEAIISGSVAYLVYTGQDASDRDLEWSSALIVGDNTVTATFNAKVMGKRVEVPAVKKPKGIMEPQVIVDAFKAAFGGA